MSIIKIVGGKDVLPVWALPYANTVGNTVLAGFEEAIQSLAHQCWTKAPEFMTAYRCGFNGEVVTIDPKEWWRCLDTIAMLTEGLKDEEKKPGGFPFQNYERWRGEVAKRLPTHAFVYLDEFNDWYYATIENNIEHDGTHASIVAAKYYGREPICIPYRREDYALVLDPMIPDEVLGKHKAWFSLEGAGMANNDRGGQSAWSKPLSSKPEAVADSLARPVAEMRLSDFLRLLEPKSRFANGGHKFKLHKMLDEGLRFYSLSGGPGIYGGFTANPVIGDVPVKIEAYGEQCPYLPIEAIFGERDETQCTVIFSFDDETPTQKAVVDFKDELDGFIVRLEDAAEYYGRADTDYCFDFPWLDESGKALSLLPNEYRKNAYQPYLKAEKYLKDKWKATPEEIAMWLIGDKIKTYSSIYSGAWIIDVVNYKLRVNLNEFLFTCHFDEGDLAQFEPDERWFTYPELTERWSNYDFTPECIEALIRKHYKNQDWLLIVNNPRQWHSQKSSAELAESNSILERKSKATLEHIESAMYPLSDIIEIEIENGLVRVLEEPKTGQTTEWRIARQTWYRQTLLDFNQYLIGKTSEATGETQELYQKISGQLLEYFSVEDTYSCIFAFQGWLKEEYDGMDCNSQFDNSPLKTSVKITMAEFERRMRQQPNPQDLVTWYRGSMGQTETVPALLVAGTHSDWRNDPKLMKGEKQRLAILEMIALKKYDPMNIPDGEKGTLKKLCESEYPELFDGDTSFDSRWKKGNNTDWRMTNYASYAKRGK